MQNTTAIAMERWFRFIIVSSRGCNVLGMPSLEGSGRRWWGMGFIARMKYLSNCRKIWRNTLLNIAISCHLT